MYGRGLWRVFSTKGRVLGPHMLPGNASSGVRQGSSHRLNHGKGYSIWDKHIETITNPYSEATTIIHQVLRRCNGQQPEGQEFDACTPQPPTAKTGVAPQQSAQLLLGVKPCWGVVLLWIKSILHHLKHLCVTQELHYRGSRGGKIGSMDPKVNPKPLSLCSLKAFNPKHLNS